MRKGGRQARSTAGRSYRKQSEDVTMYPSSSDENHARQVTSCRNKTTFTESTSMARLLAPQDWHVQSRTLNGRILYPQHCMDFVSSTLCSPCIFNTVRTLTVSSTQYSPRILNTVRIWYPQHYGFGILNTVWTSCPQCCMGHYMVVVSSTQYGLGIRNTV